MRKSYAAALLLIVIAAISAPAAAQGGITGPSQSFYNADPIGFVDSLTVTDINNAQDFLVFVILPLIGVYGLMWFLFSKVLQMAENNFANNSSPTSDDLSEMGQKAAVLMAAAVAVVTVMRFGNFSPIVTLILFLLALYLLFKNGLGFVGAGGNGQQGPQGPQGPQGNRGPQGPPGDSPDLPDDLVTSDDLPHDLGGDGGDGSDAAAAAAAAAGAAGAGGGQGGGQGGGPGGVTQDVNLSDLVNIEDNSAQDMAAMMQQAQQQMQQQQMQMTPGIMQMMALMQGRVVPRGGGILIDPPNGPNVTVQQQQINQLMQMMVQVMSEGDKDFDMNVMMQMMQVVVKNGGDLDGDLIQILEQYLQKIEVNPKIVQINNMEIEKVVNQQYYDISQVMVQQFQQFFSQNNVDIDVLAYHQFINLLELNVTSNQGDTIIIHSDDGDVEIDVDVIVQFISVVENFPSSMIGVLIEKLVNVFVDTDGPLTQDILVDITNIMINIEEGGDPSEVGPEGADIKIEELELVTVEGHRPFPRVRKNGGYVHVVPEGATTKQIGIHAMVSCNQQNGLQQITFNFDDNQRDLGLNSSSYGHDENDVIPLSELAGEHTFREGQMHNFGVNAVGQLGNNENTVGQIEVWARADAPEETPELPSGDPELEPGPEVPPLPEGDGPEKLIDEIDDIISDLDSELDLEEGVLQEKEDAEQKLAEALRELVDNRDILQALIYFREVDFDAPHAEVHQQVEKILDNLQGVGSADHMQREMKDIQQAFGKVEKALEELQDAYEKMGQGAEVQKRDQSELRDIADTVDELSEGGGNLKTYLDEYY